MYARTNIQRFSKFSLNVKLAIFKAYVCVLWYFVVVEFYCYYRA